MFIHDTHLTQISVVVVRVLFVYIYQAIDISKIKLMNLVSSCYFYTYTLMMQISICKIIPNPGIIEISTLNLPIKTSAEMPKKGINHRKAPNNKPHSYISNI